MTSQDNLFFNAQHAPVGAFATFTLGFPGAKGGLGLELGKPADQSIYIGLESKEPGVFQALPFFEGFEDPRARFDLGIGDTKRPQAIIEAFAKEDVHREFSIASDTWHAGDLTFTIYNPTWSIPDPQQASPESLKKALVPVILAELTIDNTQYNNARKAFFGFQGTDPYAGMRRLDETTHGKICGIGQGRHLAIASTNEDIYSGLGFSIAEVLAPLHPENLPFALGMVGGLVASVPAREKKTFRFAICFYRGGMVTTGMDCAYYYTKFFQSIDQVAVYALDHFDSLKADMQQAAEKFDTHSLSSEQQFMLAHAIHSYYASTQMLVYGTDSIWVVNEGEYRMMNTLDLTVDQLFYEMRMNPWTVRNTLDLSLDRYSYRDKVRLPGDSKEYPGGISFTHDMGIANVFSRPRHSCYEQFGLTGCFSHMTQEQLINWIACATIYIEQTNDRTWLKDNHSVLLDCLESMVNRDHTDPVKRNGIMGLDSSRCKGGSEITTYDSLDASLGQARNSVYLAVKGMAAYLGLQKVLKVLGETDAAGLARRQAELCAATVLQSVDANNTIPAVLEEHVQARIIPVIEGLALIWFGGTASALQYRPFNELLDAFRHHLIHVLVPGKCLFEDGGWKLSSTSDNSWLSKIYICQFVIRKILGMPANDQTTAADKAHVNWLLHPELSCWCWSDQIVAGRIEASKYYPRGVTSIIWLYEKVATHFLK